MNTSINKVLQPTAIAHPNIAFIKYWGNADDHLRIPVNGSISMNLAALTTRTSVQVDAELQSDQVSINGLIADQISTIRITRFLSIVRQLADRQDYARVVTTNDFPAGSGIASSASGFAALAVAASSAYGLRLAESDLSRLARRGSGSASRSIPSGFVEWQPGTSDADSFAFSIAPPSHWDLVDIIAVIDEGHKKTGSTEGHHLANTSPLQTARVADAFHRITSCRKSILERDFDAFAMIVEHDCLLMHAVMMTSTPALLYWHPATLEIINRVISLRSQGLPVCFTIDAGPNVHVLTQSQHQLEVLSELQKLSSIQSILVSIAGGGAHLVEATEDGCYN